MNYLISGGLSAAVTTVAGPPASGVLGPYLGYGAASVLGLGVGELWLAAYQPLAKDIDTGVIHDNASRSKHDMHQFLIDMFTWQNWARIPYE